MHLNNCPNPGFGEWECQLRNLRLGRGPLRSRLTMEMLPEVPAVSLGARSACSQFPSSLWTLSGLLSLPHSARPRGGFARGHARPGLLSAPGRSHFQGGRRRAWPSRRPYCAARELPCVEPSGSPTSGWSPGPRSRLRRCARADRPLPLWNFLPAPPCGGEAVFHVDACGCIRAS